MTRNTHWGRPAWAGGLLLATMLSGAIGAADEPKKMVLFGKDTADLSAWRGKTGDWMIVGEAKMSADDPKLIATSPGRGVAVNGPTGRTVNLQSKVTHGDVEAHVEFMVPQGSNSGLYFQGRYEVQVLDSYGVKDLKHGDCGGIYQRYDEKAGRGYEGSPPRVNASRAPGQWQSFDIIFRAPRFDATGEKVASAKFVKVVHNGVLLQENVEVTGPTRAAAFEDEKPTGPLMLQGDHGPVAYRNLWILPLEAKP